MSQTRESVCERSVCVSLRIVASWKDRHAWIQHRDVPCVWWLKYCIFHELLSCQHITGLFHVWGISRHYSMPIYNENKTSNLFSSSGEVNQHRLEFGLYADHVQHDPIRSEKNTSYGKRRLCWPHLSIFSANHFDRCLSLHPPHSHLLLRVRDKKGVTCCRKAAVIL